MRLVRVARPAAALLALLAVGAGPSLDRTDVAANVVLAWQPTAAPEAFRLTVPRSALAAFLEERGAALEAERDAMLRRATEALAHEYAAFEAALIRGLPDFTDWAYGWVESYVTAYVVLGEVIGQQVAPGPDGRMPPWQSYRAALDGVVADRFEALILRPADLPAWRTRAQARLDAVLRDAWSASLLAEGEAWERFLVQQGRITGRGVPSPGCTISPPAVTLPVPMPASPDQPALMTLRAARPFAGRGALLALRLGSGAGAAELTGLLGTVVQPSISGIASLASGFLTLWIGDWLLSQLDGALHRGNFTAAVSEAVVAQRAAAEAETRAALEAALDTAFASRRGCASEVVPA